MKEVRTLDLLGPLDLTPTLVEASAGTGKTFSIAFMCLRLVAEVGVKISEVLVVTFTDAATKELRDRVRARLVDARDALAADDALPEDPLLCDWLLHLDALPDLDRPQALRRLQLALVDFDEACISTIHGFCRRVLTEHAFESGASFDDELIKSEGAFLEMVVEDMWISTLWDAPAAHIDAMEEGKLRLESALKFFEDSLRARPDRVLRAVGDITGTGRPQDVGAFKYALVMEGLAKLQKLKRDAHVMAFGDLLTRVRDAMPDRESELARKVGARFKAVLVDEFQDTDPVQSQILRHAFQGRSFLTFIGDPKQAIYRFRGADIFAYLDAARRFRDNATTLTSNFRSDEPLLQALNHLFGRPDLSPFHYDAITYQGVRSGRTDSKSALGEGVAPLRFMWVDALALDSPGDTNKRVPKPKVTAGLATLCAEEILKLLKGSMTLHGRPIQCPDIAVLVRSNPQALRVQEALTRRGIPSVVRFKDAVWQSPEATQVLDVLRAVAHPHDGRALRRALITSLFGFGRSELLALESNPSGWDRHAQSFRAWNRRWRERGFIQMFHALLIDADVAAHVLAFVGGERSLTNILHVVELIHTRATEGDLQIEGVLNDVAIQCAEGADHRGEDAAELRLESDASAVQVLTVHKSKGLEFPIVFCPYLWNDAKMNRRSSHALFHDPDSHWELTMDLGSDDLQRGQDLEAEESYAEELRLAYVALTRAKHAVFLPWGYFKDAEKSPLMHLLHANSERVDSDSLRKTIKNYRAIKETRLWAELDEWVRRHPGLMSLDRVDTPQGEGRYDAPARTRQPQAARLVRALHRRWRVTSFSALRRGDHTPTGPAEDGRDRDAGTGTAEKGALHQTPVLLAEFPRGSHAGTFFHEILEHLDFGGVWKPDAETLIDHSLKKFGFDPVHAPIVRRAMSDIVETALRPGLRLASLKGHQRIDEMEFHLPLRVADRPFTAQRLADVFRAHQSPQIDADYPTRVEDLSFGTLEGFLKGFIDLIFEDEGKFYVVDYKSNHLGDTLDAYGQTRLNHPMSHGHYVLQYHLYLLALHRYLGLRKANYAYEKDIGGVFYLFIKGMTPRGGSEAGVYVDTPSLAMIEALSALFDGR